MSENFTVMALILSMPLGFCARFQIPVNGQEQGL